MTCPTAKLQTLTYKTTEDQRRCKGGVADGISTGHIALSQTPRKHNEQERNGADTDRVSERRRHSRRRARAVDVGVEIDREIQERDQVEIVDKISN